MGIHSERIQRSIFRYNNRFNNQGGRGGYGQGRGGYNNRHNTLNRSLPDSSKSEKSDSRLNSSAVEPVSGSFKGSSNQKENKTTTPLATSLVSYASDDDDDEDQLKIYEGIEPEKLYLNYFSNRFDS